MERISTGVKQLDKCIEGGFPANSTILVVGQPGVGKTTFAQQFMHCCLKSNISGTYITLDTPVEQIKRSMHYFGYNFGKAKGKNRFIDAYSWRSGKPVEGKYSVQDPSDLNKLNMMFVDAQQGLRTRRRYLIVDSVSTLFLYSGNELVTRFLQVLASKAEALNMVTLFLVEEGVHDSRTISTLNYLSDGLIEMRINGDERFFKVSKMLMTKHSMDWIKFEISKGAGVV